MDQALGASVKPVLMLTALKLAPASTERNTPLFVAASTMLLLPGATMTSAMTVELPRYTGLNQVLPPSVDFTRPMPVPSNGSPRPRYSVWLLAGSIASEPTERLPSVSVFGVQVAPPSVDFHTPPPEKAT